ncbi:hypothetical protein [endosymbiont of Riftia pachyptila]|uniref:hypothetical protein n=1 Tax=endosymbiont of Riftia pachyptila TaxID=54396 RepID=UPI000680B6F2|nr:hypothetical protein [endosymbiont of Riftia pachyptila]
MEALRGQIEPTCRSWLIDTANQIGADLGVAPSQLRRHYRRLFNAKPGKRAVRQGQLQGRSFAGSELQRRCRQQGLQSRAIGL